jgi:hypothetical protein
MCLSDSKFVSLVTVCGGVLGYGYATRMLKTPLGEKSDKNDNENCRETTKLILESP